MPEPRFPLYAARLLGSTCLLLMLAACAGRAQAPVPMAAAAAPSNPLAMLPAGVSDQPLPQRWWALYQDAQLNRWVQAGLAHNQDLAAAEAHLQAMLAGIGEFDAQRLPTTSLALGADYGKTADDQTLAKATDRHAPAQWAFNPGVELAYQVDVWGQVRHAIERAQVQAEAAGEAYDWLRLNVVVQISRAYVDQCTYGARIEVAQRSLQTLDRSVALSERQRQAGIATELDSTRLRSLREQVRAELPLLDAQRRMALYELAMLSGESISAPIPEADGCRTIVQLQTPLPSGDGWHLLERRPDVRKAERELRAAALEVDIVKADLYPKISFGASLTSSAQPLSALGDSHSVMFGIGPLISWQFPNLQANRARVAKAGALQQEQLAKFHSSTLGALKDVRQALALYDGERQRQQALSQALQQSQRGYALAEDNYRAGSLDALALLDSERDLIGVRASAIEAQGRLTHSEINLFRALGGNWQAPNAKTTPSPNPLVGSQP